MEYRERQCLPVIIVLVVNEKDISWFYNQDIFKRKSQLHANWQLVSDQRRDVIQNKDYMFHGVD